MEAEAPAAAAKASPGVLPGAPAPDPVPEAGPPPAVLTDLIAAGLVSHEMIGDPDRLGGEAAALKALCAVISGPVWRIEAYHYAFRAGAGDLGGRLGALAPGDWTEAIAADLAERLGPEAVWLNPTDLLPEAGAALDQPLLFLRAQAAAVSDGLATAGPEVAAVISARYAAEVARLSTGIRSPLAAHVEALGLRLDAAAEGIAALRAGPAGSPDALARALSGALSGALSEALSGALAPLAARLDAQAAALAAQTARLEGLAAAVEGEVRQLAALAAAPAGFQETLGVTLAEIIARLEQRFETGYPSLVAPLGGARAPQLS